jgi:20S proteasome alpha/beta subunit
MSILSGVEFLPLPEYRQLRRTVHNPRIVPMTVGIGAICLQAKAVVLAADRLITSGLEGDFLCYERPEGKILVFSDGVAVIVAGRAEYGHEIIARARSDPNFDTANWKSVASAIEAASETLRSEKAKLYFNRLSAETRQAEPSRRHEQQIENQRRLLKSEGFDLTFLIGAVDKDGAHLWTIDVDHGLNRQDEKGYVAIGGGWSRSATALCYRPDLKDRDLATVVYAVYEAKKVAADFTAGIGPKTDFVILQSGKAPFLLREDDFALLDKSFDAMRPKDLSSEARGLVEKVLSRT